MIRRPPRSTLFPTRRSSDLRLGVEERDVDRVPRLGVALVVEEQQRTVDVDRRRAGADTEAARDRKSTRLNSSHSSISYAVFCLKKKKDNNETEIEQSRRVHK